jgi:hypothetical protein
MSIKKEDLEEMLEEGRFVPVVLTTMDGFSIAIDNPRKTLVGQRLIVVMDKEGRFYHIPFTAIAHVSEPQGGATPQVG